MTKKKEKKNKNGSATNPTTFTHYPPLFILLSYNNFVLRSSKNSPYMNNRNPYLNPLLS
jgi:hypothetical protein